MNKDKPAPSALYPGISVITVKGELDTDHTGQERQTPPGAFGHIASHNHADHWDVVFSNGAWVVLTEAELGDPLQYTLGSPRTLEQCALALKHGQEVLELTLLDDPLIRFTEFVAGNPGHILELINAQSRLEADAEEMLGVIRRAWERWDDKDQAEAPALGDKLSEISARSFSWDQTR